MIEPEDPAKCWCGSRMKDKPHNCIGTKGRVESLMDDKAKLLLQIDQMRRALMAVNTCGHVARCGEDLIPNADRDKTLPEGWKPCACLELSLKAAMESEKETVTEKRKHDVAACEDSGCILMCKCSCHQGQGVRF